MKVIILAGGRGLRLKGDIDIPKPMLELSNGKFLLEHQVGWLLSHNIKSSDILISISREVSDILDSIYTDEFKSIFRLAEFIEDKHLGTGGAIKNIMSRVKDNVYYIMNVDDLIFSDTYAPIRDLLEIPRYYMANILMGYGRFPYGVVYTKYGWNGRVELFEQKPLITDKPIYIGHMSVTKDIEHMLPDVGDFEAKTLPYLVEKKLLYATGLKGQWMTINTIKDLNEVNSYLKPLR